MRLTSKHLERQTTIIRADFSGGLNQTANADGINENQLSKSVNVEAEHNTGRLKTVAGTVDVAKIDDIYAAMYDEINHKMLIVLNDKTVHILQNGNIGNSIGSLTGNSYPQYESWENGILIASGGKLQYFNSTTLDTIQDSPDTDNVYVRAGRIIVTSESDLRFSGVGDETNWVEKTNDDSSAKWLEVGYKDGGAIIRLINLYSDVLIIKNNRRVYRLQGEYPNWIVTEVTRNVDCSGRLSVCAVADRVFILGKTELQMISTTDAYGDMKPANVAALVAGEINQLPQNAIIRYVPALQQIWCIGTNGAVMVYDLNFNSWFKRQFNSAVIDVINIGNEVYVIKGDRISKLDENSFFDADKALTWQFKAQRLISLNNFLLKRTQISCIPLSSNLYTGQIIIGAVRVPLPIPAQNIKVKENKSTLYKNRMKVSLETRKKIVYVKGENVYENLTAVQDNKQKVFSRPTFIKVSKQIYRNKFLDVGGQGSGGGFLLNGIIMEVAEV